MISKERNTLQGIINIRKQSVQSALKSHLLGATLYFACLFRINVKTAELIGFKFFVATHMTKSMSKILKEMNSCLFVLFSSLNIALE